jgi:hypothetical protein
VVGKKWHEEAAQGLIGESKKQYGSSVNVDVGADAVARFTKRTRSGVLVAST